MPQTVIASELVNLSFRSMKWMQQHDLPESLTGWQRLINEWQRNDVVNT
jgi:hypothetical protein